MRPDRRMYALQSAHDAFVFVQRSECVGTVEVRRARISRGM